MGIGGVVVVIVIGIILITIITVKQENNKKNSYTYTSVYNSKPTLSHYNKYKGDLPRSFVVIDTETTGLSAETDEIIQLSAIKYIDCNEVGRYNQYINPGRSIPSAASKINHIYDRDVKNKPYVGEILAEFKTFIGNETLVAHNASFDMKFIQTAFHNKYGSGLDNTVVDTLKLARKHINTSNHKLETLKDFLKLKANSHDAIEDCFVAGEVYKYCIDKSNEINADIVTKNEKQSPSIKNKDNKIVDVIQEPNEFQKECYLKVVEILYRNGRDIGIIRYSQSKYFDILAFYVILRIKQLSKGNYMLIKKKDLKSVEHPFKIADAIKSEGEDKVRVFFNVAEDINYFESVILKQYDSAIKSMEHYSTHTKSGEVNKQNYLSDTRYTINIEPRE